MGACYYVEAKLWFKDEKRFVEKSNDFIDQYNGVRAVFNLANGNRRTVKGVLQIIIHKDIEHNEKAFCDPYWSAAFSASYGWEAIMIDWFSYVAETLLDGSELYIEPDSDYDKLVIAHSAVKWEH